jgi:hypothetical protein
MRKPPSVVGVHLLFGSAWVEMFCETSFSWWKCRWRMIPDGIDENHRSKSVINKKG